MSKLSFDSFFADEENFGSPKEDAIRKTIRLKENILKGCVARRENNDDVRWLVVCSAKTN